MWRRRPWPWSARWPCSARTWPARHFRIPPWYGLLFPLGYTLAAGVALYAVLCHARGAVVWKGRVYAPPGNEGSP